MNIIKAFDINNKNKLFANGMRTSRFHELTPEEKAFILREIKAIEADETKFVFNSKQHNRTCYEPEADIVYIAGDILPDVTSASNHTRDLMSIRAVLAHEYYGHRPHRDEYLQDLYQGFYTIPRWRDEYRASYEAARYCPNLNQMDKYHLIQDAIDRCQEAGYQIKNDGFMMEVLYGYKGEGEYYTECPNFGDETR